MTSTSAPTDKVLNRIRGLLAQASGTGNPLEAETFATKAAELMARHNVEQAMLAEDSGIVDPMGTLAVRLENPYAKAKASLLNGIAIALNCRLVYIESLKDGKSQGILFGHKSDIERVEFLYTSLLLQAIRMMVQVPVPGSQAPSCRAAFRRSWLSGFAARIAERLQAATTDAVEDSRPGTALVLRDRAQLATVAMEEAFPGTVKKAVAVSRSDAFRAGARAAAQADMGQARMGGSRTALVG